MESTNITPLSPPPAESHASFEELFEILQTHARNAGYAITTGNSEKRKGRVMKILVCKKSGTHRSEIDEPSRKRQRLTQKSLCPFRVKARERRDGRWDVCYLQNQDGSTNQESLLHNHEPFDPSAFPEHRRLNDDQMTILRTHNRMGIQPSRTVATLKNKYPESKLNHRDVYNITARISRESRHGRSPAEAFVNLLTEERNKGLIFFEYDRDSLGHINYLFLADLKSIELLNLYPDVLLMDCTYKTNKFGMPLLHILGIDNLSQSFTVGYCFLDNEREQCYETAISHLVSLYQPDRWPSVIGTDCEMALINAIDRHFPVSQTKRIICFWHVSKNLMVNCKARFGTGERWETFERFFSAVVHSKTPEEYLDRVEEFKAEFWFNGGELHVLPESATAEDLDRHTTFCLEQEAVKYALGQWLEPHHQRIVHAWTNQFFNRDTSTTSRLEGAHAVLKKWIGSPSKNLASVWESI